MREIELTKGMKALVDDADFEQLNEFAWHAARSRNTWYAARLGPRVNGKRKWIGMHRQIAGVDDSRLVDHRDGSGLNNLRSNLRVCNRAENSWNRHTPSDSRSGFLGIWWDKRIKRWRASVRANGKNHYAGSHKSPEEAALSRDRKAQELHGEFVTLNGRSAT